MAEETKKMPTEVHFFFEYDKDYRIVAANGVWIGITPRGDIHLDFFVERLGIPESTTNKITEDGRLGDEINRQPKDKLTRRLQVGVLLSLEHVESMVNFLTTKIADMKKIKPSL